MNRFVSGAVALAAAGIMSVTGLSGVTAQDAVPHPAHIHTGSCPTPGEVVAPLSDVGNQALNNGTPTAMDKVGQDGAIPVLSSVTTVDLALADILAAEHAINIHMSADDMGTYVACGNIGGMMIGETDLTFGIAGLNDSNLTGVGSLHDNGDGTTTVYVYLTAAADGDATPVASPDGGMDGMDMGTPEA
jgi:hypothetical protein